MRLYLIMQKWLTLLLFWGFFSFKSHFKPHPYRIIIFNWFRVLIKWNNKLRRASSAKEWLKQSAQYSNNIPLINLPITTVKYQNWYWSTEVYYCDNDNCQYFIIKLSLIHIIQPHMPFTLFAVIIRITTAGVSNHKTECTTWTNITTASCHHQ